MCKDRSVLVTAGGSPGVWSSDSTGEIARVNGVRSSWETLAKKRLFRPTKSTPAPFSVTPLSAAPAAGMAVVVMWPASLPSRWLKAVR